MEKIKWLKVENYRGIKKAELRDFGDINIIVGKNNTGKSTILESIYINVTGQGFDILGNDPITFILRRRGVSLRFPFSLRMKIDVDDLFRYLSYFFYQGNIEKTIKFVSNLHEYGLRVFKDEIPEVIAEKMKDLLRGSLLSKEEVGQLIYVVVDIFHQPILVAFETWRYLVESEEQEVYETEYNLRLLSKRMMIKKIIKGEDLRKVVLIDSHTLLTHSHFELSALLTTLRRLEKIAPLDKQKLARFISEQLENNVKTMELGIFDIYAVTEDDVYIPFSLLGDGTKVSIAYFYVLSLKDAYILFEEPENHLHPRLMSKCIDLIIDSAKNNQIFITTHSLEFLETILEKAKDSDIDLKVFSISSLKDGILEYDSFTLNEAYSAVNKIGVDLR